MIRYQNSATSKDVAYTYDPFGRRIRKIDGSATIFYVWDGDQLLAEYDASGDRQVRYAYAKGFAPIQVAYANGAGENVYDVHSDHLDTPMVLTGASGAVAWRAAHEAFGKASLDAGNAVTFNIRFPGQYYDAESGLHYNRYRTMDAGTGRYLESDPRGQGIAINVYAYARDNPLSYFDALGLEPGSPDDCDRDPRCNPSGHGASDLDKKCCDKSKPMSSNSNPNPYAPGDSYRLVSARAMYRYGGDGPWGKSVRGCLVCMYTRGVEPNSSHAYCYARADDEQGGPLALDSLTGFVRAVVAAAGIGFAEGVVAVEVGNPRAGIAAIGMGTP